MASTFGVGILGILGAGQEGVAQGTLTFTGVVIDAQTVTIGADVYEFDVSGGVTSPNILVDVSASQTAQAAVTALVAQINASHTEPVSAAQGLGTSVVVTSTTDDGTGATIATTETCTNASWGAVTLVGGYGVEATATQRLPMISETLDDVQALNRDVSLQGRGFERPPDPGTIGVQGDVACYLRYTPRKLLLKQFFGLYASGKYTLSPQRKGKGLTLAVNEQISVKTAIGCKVSQIVLASSLTDVRLTATIIGQTLIRNSSKNTLAVLQQLADSDRNLLHRHLTFLIGDQVNALNTTDDHTFRPGTYTLTMAMPHDQVFIDSPYADEPLDNGFPTYTLAIAVPRHLTDVFKTWQAANTGLQAQATWTNGTNTLVVLLQSLNLQTAPITTPGPGVRAITLTLHASEGLVVYTASTISAASGDNSYNDSATALPYCQAGDQVQITGFTAHPENNKIATVVSYTTAKIVVSGVTLVTEAAGAPITLRVLKQPIVITET